MVSLINISPGYAMLQVRSLNQDQGFAIINVKPVEIVNETVTILHLIDPHEIYSVIVDIESYISNVRIINKGLILKEIQVLKSKLKSIIPLEQNRFKRGLANVVGSWQKWLFGTMDDEDRNIITEHLNIVAQNSHSAISAINKQISINEHFSDSIKLLKSTILNDRNKTILAIKELQSQNEYIAKQFQFSDIMFKLKFIENRINQIQDNIASAKHNIFHPSILTSDEIETYKIDFYKLKLVKQGVMYYNNSILVFAIKIPTNFETTDVKLILPIPNTNFLEIEEEPQYIVKISNINYLYKEHTILQKLVRSPNCVFHNNCKLKINIEQSVIYIDEETIIIKNAKNDSLIHNCNDRGKINVNGNNLILFYNCKIKILNNEYSNRKFFAYDKFAYENDKTLYNFTKKHEINFNQLKVTQIDNIKMIEELKSHRNISYGINGTIVIIMIVTLTVIFIVVRKHNIRIKIQKNIQHKTVQEIAERYDNI